MEVRGAEVPRIVTAEAGWSTQAVNWENRLPARKLPRKTVTTWAPASASHLQHAAEAGGQLRRHASSVACPDDGSAQSMGVQQYMPAHVQGMYPPANLRMGACLEDEVLLDDACIHLAPGHHALPHVEVLQQVG